MFIHSEAFLRGVNELVAGQIETPAAGVTQPLRFREIRLTLPQGFLDPFALGDVAYKNDGLTAGNGLVLSTDFDVKQAAVFPAVGGFKTVRAQVLGLSDVGGDHFGAMHSLYILNIHGQEFLLAIAAHLAVSVVDLKDSSLHVGAQEAVHGHLERGPVAFFAFTQRLVEKNFSSTFIVFSSFRLSFWV